MHRLGDYYKEVLQEEMNKVKESEEIYHHFEFHDEAKRKVHSFKLRSFLSGKCNQRVEELATNSKIRFSFKVQPILELKLFSYIKKLLWIFFHKFLNKTKEIIYIHNYNFTEESEKKSLKEEYPFIENAFIASLVSSLRQYFPLSICKNSQVISIYPDNHQILLYTSTKTDHEMS